MNLHGMVRGLIQAVNPDVPVMLRRSAGYSIDDTGERKPTYMAPVVVQGQIQPLGTDDLALMDGLNIQGNRCKIYMSGNVDVVVRRAVKGGDLMVLPDGTTWLVTTIAENWPDWTSAILVQQDDT